MSSSKTMDTSRLMRCLYGKTVLVTGGTGSFGSTFVSMCAGHKQIKKIIVYSRDEQKHVAMHRHFKDPRIQSIVGDVRDLNRLQLAMKGVNYVFNAAAIKHVHLTEEHPMEAVATNVMGIHNVCIAALDAGVECLVTLSTDKAVEPVNVMGMTKALQERIAASYSNRGMRIGIIRYGNVLASNGSVVPFFKYLLENRETVLPVTDRRMTRFVLTLHESVDLVLYALNYCKAGETFVLNSPAFTIWDVAEVMADVANAGSKSKRVVLVKETGIRPGEKLHETLVSSEEMRRASLKGRFWLIKRYRSGEQRFKPSREEKSFRSDLSRMLSKKEIKALLRKEKCFSNDE
jgi:UDP-N-acetylglucosamine 4,6-dehydratase/5-epimerase